MSIKEIIFPLIIGIIFGFALVKAGLTKYSHISGVFRFTDLTVLKFMLTAIVVAGFGVFGLRALGAITMLPVPYTFLPGNVLGGLIFGVGMSLAGFCPGNDPCRCRRRQTGLLVGWGVGHVHRYAYLRSDL